MGGLTVTGVHKRFGQTRALDGMDLRVDPGEIVGLIGHNGAGKSTLVNVVTGLVKPDQGAVDVDGIDAVTDRRAARARLGLAPQTFAIYPNLTVWENLRLFGGLAGLRGRQLRRRSSEVADALALAGMMNRRVYTLSGGQQRRLHAATALLGEPAVLLLDEPTVGADPETRKALLACVRARADDMAAVCYTTHYLPELEHLQATLAVMAAGKVIARGSRLDLLARLPGGIRLTFGSAVPPGLTAVPGCHVDEAGDQVLIQSSNPAADLPELMRGLGPAAGTLKSVEVMSPTLDDLYHDLSASLGRRILDAV